MRQNNRGVVLVAGLLFLAIVTVVAVSFLVIVRQEGTASVNASYSEQARLAARAGLAQAISTIESVKAQVGLYVLEVGLGPLDGRILYFDPAEPGVGEKVGDPDYLSEPPINWVEPFLPLNGQSALTISAVVNDEARWIDPYGGQIFGRWDAVSAQHDLTALGNGLRGRAYPLTSAGGLVAHYAVRVVDLDGRLHLYPGNFGAESWDPSNDLDAVFNVLEQEETFDFSSIKNAVGIYNDGNLIRNPGEVSLTAGIINYGIRNKVHDLFTVYPADEPTKFTDNNGATRPAVNINSARKSVLHALLVRIPGFADNSLRDQVVLHLIGNRPFSGRQHLEAVLADLAPAPIGDGTLSEQQFNDLLNSLNKSEPSLFERGGDFNYNFIDIDLLTPGLYAFNFDPALTAPSESEPPEISSPPTTPALVVSNTGGNATEDSANVTWLTEVKFLSRFYHIIAVGQALDFVPMLDVNGNRILDANGNPVGHTRATRRIQAVYDIGVDFNISGKIIYYRNNLTEYGNLGDLGP